MSELYTLPHGWEWKKLGEVVKINSGIALPSIFKDKEISDGEYEFFKVAQMNNDDKVMQGADLNFTKEESINYKIKLFPKGSILIPKRGGAILTNKKRILEREASYDSNIMGLKANNKILTDEFLFVFLNSINLSDYIDTSTIPQINNKHIDMMNISIPPLQEQQRIVAKLDKLFGKIDKAIALHQKNIDEANVFMSSVLNEVFEEMEEKYEVKTLNEVCIKITDGTHNTPTYTDNGINFLSVKDISQGIIDFSNTKYISKDEHTLLSKRCNVEKNDILYTKVGTTGIAKMVDTDIKFSIFVSIALLKPKKDLIDSMYLQHILNSPNCYQQSQNKTRGMANRNLVLKDIKEIKMPLPPLHIQQQVVSYLDDISHKINRVKQIQKQKMTNLKALKASILDKAFRGEI